MSNIQVVVKRQGLFTHLHASNSTTYTSLQTKESTISPVSFESNQTRVRKSAVTKKSSSTSILKLSLAPRHV